MHECCIFLIIYRINICSVVNENLANVSRLLSWC